MLAWMLQPALAQGQVPFLSTEDAGVSDQFLVSLGTGAEAYLISSLKDRRQEPHYLGIVLRLETVGYIDRPRAPIFFALRDFIEKQVRRDEDIGKTIGAVTRAFRGIGARGGDAGVEYLLDWARKPAKLRGVRCYRGGTAANAQALILRSVILGLGFSGSPKAAATLDDLLVAANRRQDVFLRAAIEEAAALNRKVATDPLEGRYQLRRLKQLGLEPIGLQVHGKR